MKYYRAIHELGYTGANVLKPFPISHEATDDYGNLVYDVYDNEPFFQLSNKPIICFSKTKVGAITGAITGERGFNCGNFYIVTTTDKPDVDLSNKHIGDFFDIKEVRYTRPIKVEYHSNVYVNSSLAKDVALLYQNSRFDKAVKLVKEGLS